RTGSPMSGNVDDNAIVQIFGGPPLQPGSVMGMSNLIVSTAGDATPATHPMDVSVEAPVIVAPTIPSPHVQVLSFVAESPVLLTVIVAPAGGTPGATPGAAVMARSIKEARLLCMLAPARYRWLPRLARTRSAYAGCLLSS